MIPQVGKDQEAQEFLGKLDNDPVVGPMVDATSYFELEAEEYRKKGVVGCSCQCPIVITCATLTTETRLASTQDIPLELLGSQVLTPDLWLVKLMVGAIDPSYDEQD